jgi:hypothetical protein
MFMNRWLKRKEIVELNGLTKEEEALVFSRVAPIDGSLGRYLEETVDRAIGAVRGGVRPRGSGEASVLGEREKNMSDLANVLGPIGDLPLNELIRQLVITYAPPPPVVLPPPDPRLELLTLKEAAVPMRRSEHTLWRWCRDGRIGRKVGGGRNYFISRHEINEYLRGRLMVHGEVDK